MDFSLSEDQRILLDSFEKFGGRGPEPLADEYDRNKTLRDPSVVRDLLKKVQSFGATARSVPEEYGGLGLDYVTTGLISEKLVLPVICAGDSIACLCATEPNVGS